MTRYLCINENNILKSISDKLYVYEFDPSKSGISTDNNTKLITIGTNTIKYYSDLPSSMVERCDDTPIELVGRFELKPRIQINGIYYYSKYENTDVTPSINSLYIDKSTNNKYLYLDTNEFIQVVILEGVYSEDWIYSTLSSNPEPDPTLVYHDSVTDSYYRFINKNYSEVSVVNCYINNGIAYQDDQYTTEITPHEDIPYYDILTESYYRWNPPIREEITCYEGYKDDDNFYDSLNSIYSPETGCLYHDTSNNRYYIYNGLRYTQQYVTPGYYYNGKMYSDINLLDEISLTNELIYFDKLTQFYFRYYSDTWTSLLAVNGYLDNGNFYDQDGNLVEGLRGNIYIDNGIYYLYFNDRYIKIQPVRCYYEDGKLSRNVSNPVFIYSCIISDELLSPSYHIVETGEYSIVPVGMDVNEYINLVNSNSQSIFLAQSGNDLDYLQVANIFGINLKDTSPNHHFNDISPYGKNNRVLLDEKMQIAQWVRTLRLKYPSIVFYTDPNDRGKISTHSNEFVYYQAKLFSDDSQYTTPLRYNDYRYGKVRNYDIPIYVRYESPDMVTFLNRRNEFLMHEFLNPLQDVELNLDNGDLIHIGVNWSRAIREEEPDKNVDASERNVYMFTTQCNLNGLLLEKTEDQVPIEEIIARIYVTSEIN